MLVFLLGLEPIVTLIMALRFLYIAIFNVTNPWLRQQGDGAEADGDFTVTRCNRLASQSPGLRQTRFRFPQTQTRRLR